MLALRLLPPSSRRPLATRISTAATAAARRCWAAAAATLSPLLRRACRPRSSWAARPAASACAGRARRRGCRWPTSRWGRGGGGDRGPTPPARPAHAAPSPCLQAGCPVAAACLWDVTDRDLDRFTAALVTAWLLPDYADAAAAAAAAAPSAGAASSAPGDAGGPLDLSLAAALSRGVCKLPALVGLAPVCYGLPVHATP